jgi:CO/xanthine dehydrogenase FAD-binding subunit
VDQALELMAASKTVKLIAGGTDLSVQIAEQAHVPDLLVDLSRITALQKIEWTSGGLRIGAAVSIATLAAETLPLCLIQGARSIGSPQIRTLATIGGNICNASPCGDTLAPLIALNAHFRLVSATVERDVPAEEFFLGPKQTVLAQDEILTEVLIDPPYLQGASSFRMIGQREGQVISQVNLALWGNPSPDGLIRDLRAAVGSVSPVPLRLHQLEQLLVGKQITLPFDPGWLRETEKAIDEQIKPISDVRATEDYRRLVAGGLFEDALAELMRQGGGS